MNLSVTRCFYAGEKARFLTASVKERDLTNKARAQVLLPARSFLIKKDPLTLTSCIGPLKLIGVFARLSWSDLRGDRCAIFSPDSTCVPEVARSSSKNARHQFFRVVLPC